MGGGTISSRSRPEKGLLGVGLLASVLGERFGNHMPYDRLEKMYAGEGPDLSPNVLERSAARCAERLAPLHELLRERVRSADALFTDDTPMTIARPADREEGSKTERIWAYLARVATTSASRMPRALRPRSGGAGAAALPAGWSSAREA